VRKRRARRSISPGAQGGRLVARADQDAARRKRPAAKRARISRLRPIRPQTTDGERARFGDGAKVLAPPDQIRAARAPADFSPEAKAGSMPALGAEIGFAERLAWFWSISLLHLGGQGWSARRRRRL